MAKEERLAYDGMANLASSVRRSTALYVAMQVTDPGSTIDEMLDNADRLAAWIGGPAEERERNPPRPSNPLGQPWGQEGGPVEP